MVESILNSFDVWTAVQGVKSKGRVKSIDNISLEGIAKLREVILELAVRGKLVPQDERDEPASRLIRRIKTKKADLIKSGSLRKPNELPKIADDEEPFQLPKNWEWVRLGEITNKIGSGSTPRGSAYSESGIIFLRSQNIYNDGLVLDDVVYISEETNSKMSNTIVLPNDILLNITGGSLGRSTVFSSQYDKANVSQHVTIIRPTENTSTPYLHLCILSPYVQNLIWGRQVGAAREGLSKKVLELFEIPLPPLAEQHRIVAKVDELMALCDELEEVQTTNLKTHQALVKTLLQTLTGAANADELHAAWQRMAPHFDTLFGTEDSIEQLQQTVLQLAIMGRLVPQSPTDEPATALLKRIKAEKEKLVKAGKLKKEKPLPPIAEDEVPFALPEGWVICKIDDLCEVVRGGSPRPAGDLRYYDGNIPFLKVADLTATDDIYLDIHTYSIKEAGLHKTRFVEADTLMLTNSGATLGIPKICRFPTTFNDGVAAFLNLSEAVDKVYFYYFLKSKSKWYLEVASRGQGQPNLNTDIIKATIFPLPPLAEQQRIVAKVQQLQQQLSQLATRLQQSNTTAQQLLQTVLQQAFEGKGYAVEEEEELRMVAEN